MAVLVGIVCQSCGENTQEVVGAGQPTPQICSHCTEDRRRVDRLKHLRGLTALSLMERLERIEQWIYDYKPQYVEPPRF